MYSYDLYFPIFWWTDKDKQLFDEVLGIKHSECYGTYGMKRTGCPGCPFGQRYEDEINSIAEFEPQLNIVVDRMFGETYDFTRKYKAYQALTKPPRKERPKKKKEGEE